MAIDIPLARAHTPATAELIHFNNAGAALTPTPVQEVVLQHLALEQRIGAYEAAEQVTPAIENFYLAFASLLNCHPDEIAYAENATHAWNSLFYAIPLQKGDRILTGQSEYASNYLNFLHLSRTKQIVVDVIPNDALGQICLTSLEAAIDSDTKLIALTHVPSQCGVVHPAAEVGKIARTHGILYLLDACQSAGQLALDVEKLGCDMLTGTGRKYLRGPRGTGFLYVRRESMQRLQPAWLDLHSAHWIDDQNYEFRTDARRFENWECFVAGKLGLGAAADYAVTLGLLEIEQRITDLAAELRLQLQALPGVIVHEKGSTLSGIVTFSREQETPSNLHKRLQKAGINTSVSRLRSNLLDFKRRGIQDVNRASVHYYNTEEEIIRFCQTVNSR